MRIKKALGKVIGAELSKTEERALNMEIQKRLAEYNRMNQLEIDAIILWQLHKQLGLGPERLRRFYDTFSVALRELNDRYEMGSEEDQLWLCIRELKEYGIDVEAWERENSNLE